jgi:hypothetical protein
MKACMPLPFQPSNLLFTFLLASTAAADMLVASESVRQSALG